MKKVVKYIKIIKKSVNNVTAERLFIIMSNKFIVETSARHVHLTQEHLEILFGKNAKLTNKKDLSQPGQFACEERVTIVGPKKSMPNVSILGPVRPETQVELSATDARSIGISAPIRESGDIEGSGACKTHNEKNRSFRSGFLAVASLRSIRRTSPG